MKRIETDGYKAKMVKGSGYLATASDTLDGIKKEIHKSNGRAIRPLQYIIIHEEVYTYLDDDGEFVKKETIEQAIEKYPTEVI